MAFDDEFKAYRIRIMLFYKLKNSLQLKLIFSVVIVTSFIQGSFSAVKIYDERQEALLQMANIQERIINELKYGLTDPLWNFDLDHVKILVNLKLKERDFVGIVVDDLETEEKLIGFFKIDNNIVESFKPPSQDLILRRIEIKKNNFILWQADCYFTDRYVLELILRNITYSALTILGLTTFLTILLILTLNLLVTKPIKKISDLLNSITKGEFSNRIIIRQTDEIGKICQEVNSLMEQLQSAISEVNQVMGSMAQSDFSKRITGPLQGDLKKLKQHTNKSIEILDERTKQLKAAQQELIDKAHQAGMADIASGTLHNVGNILNSVKVSAQLIRTNLNVSNVSNFKRANDLLRENIDRLEDFIVNDPKGKKLMDYYLKLESIILEEHRHVMDNLDRLNEKIDMIADVIAAQQSYAGISSLTEVYSLETIIEDALTLQSGSINQYGIKIIRDITPLPLIPIQKTKLVHIIINLIKNAKESMVDLPVNNRVMKISIEQKGEYAYMKISDSGSGISEKNLKKIFTHGFTTKKDGHGFGLHSCANYMMEMHGKIWAESEGEGKGATFVLQFQLPSNENKMENTHHDAEYA